MPLEVGQRFDVFEILRDNVFAAIPGQDIKIGQQRVADNLEDDYSGVQLQSNFGPCYHYPVKNQLKKVATLKITKVK